MPRSSFDDLDLQAAMAVYLDLSTALDEASSTGSEPRQLLDLAEAKTVAALALRRRLEELGWTAPVSQRSTT
jgi:hypothetical protein